MGDVAEVSVISKTFSETYCTAEQASIDPEGTKDKVVISADAYATGTQLEKVYNAVNVLGFRLARLR